MADTKLPGLGGFVDQTITAGNSLTMTKRTYGKALSIIVEPASGATATLEVSLSSDADIAADTAHWYTEYTGTGGYAGVIEADRRITGVRVTAADAAVVFQARANTDL